MPTYKLEIKDERCLDALTTGCPDRSNCARWEYRNANVDLTTPRVKFGIARGDFGCEHYLRIEDNKKTREYVKYDVH